MDLLKTMEQIESWTDDACSLIGAKLSISSEKEPRKNLHNLYYELTDYVKQSTRQPETYFLAYTAIDAYLTRLPYLYPVTLQQLIDNKPSILKRIADIQALQAEIRENPVYQEWNQVVDNILTSIKAIYPDGDSPLAREDIDNLSEVTPILLDAMSVPTEWELSQWKKGEDVGPGKPYVYWNMPSFRNLYQFTESLRHSPQSRCIAFGMIEPLVEDASDPLLSYFGERPELIRNVLNHEGEKGLKSTHGGFAVLGLKRGGNIYVLQENLSWDKTPYNRDSFDYYGRRSSYMPYQVTFPNAEGPGLVVRDNPAWDLRRFLDKEQALWLPTMVTAVQRAYFDTEQAVQQEECWVMTEGLKLLPAPELEELMCYSAVLLPTGLEWDSPYSEAADELLSHLQITYEDVKDIPLELPSREAMPYSKYVEKLQERAREAVAMAAEQRLWELFDRTELKVRNIENRFHRYSMNAGLSELSRTYVNAVLENMETIFSTLDDKESRIRQITTIRVNGEGKERTSVSDGNIHYTSNDTVWWFEPITLANKRPPVAIVICPECPEDLALLMGKPLEELDWRFRFWKRCYPVQTYDGHMLSCSDPVLQIKNPYEGLGFHVRINMGKWEFKAHFPTCYEGRKNNGIC